MARRSERVANLLSHSELLEAAPDAIVVVDRAGVIRRVNHAAEALFSYAPGELVGRRVEVLVPKGLRDAHRGYRAAYLTDPRVRPMAADAGPLGLRKDGSEFPVGITLSSMGSGDGQFVIAAVRDISAWRAAEAEVRRLVGVVNASRDAIIGATLDGTVFGWNPAAERLFGYWAEEMRGRSMLATIPAERRYEFADLRARLLRGESIEDFATVRVTKDGRRVAVSLTLSPMRDAAGQVTGVAAIVRDIGERLRDEQKFHALLEAAPDAIVVVDAAGTIRLVNRKVEALFGYTREELVGQSVETLVPERARAIHPGHRARYLADPIPREMNPALGLGGRRKDGSEFPIDVSLSALEAGGEVLVTAAVRDITARQRLEAQLERAQRLESVARLAGGVAHDFNNLLAIILNHARFAQRSLAPTSPLRNEVEEIVRAARRGAALTRQLLVFGRREIGRPTLVDFGAVVPDLERLARPILGERVRLTTRIPPGLWPVNADRSQMEQVLLNLVLNARDAMPNGGTLTISAENVTLDADTTKTGGAEAAGPCVRLIVSDSGAGMTKEVLDRAFEPFFTTKEKGENAGLGLAIVYGIVTQSGGAVHLESEPGRGTSVVITLPAAAAEPVVVPHEHRADAAAADARGETVLVVEDEAPVRSLMARILERHGYVVLEAADAGAALLECQRHPGRIDLLLADLVLPLMSGKQLAGLVRRVCPDAAVLYCSGYPQDVIAEEGELDAPLLEKPFEEETLLQTVRDALETRTAAGTPVS